MRPRITLAMPILSTTQAGVDTFLARFVNIHATVPVLADARAVRGRGHCSMPSP